MLQVFEIVREAIPPTVRAEGPEFRIAEHQEEQAANQKTGRPCEAGRGPALAKLAFPKKENASENYKESSQMMVKFTLFFVLGEDSLLRRAFCLALHRHRHIRALVAGVNRIYRGAMGRGRWNAQGEQCKKESEFNHHLAGFLVVLAGVFLLGE